MCVVHQFVFRLYILQFTFFTVNLELCEVAFDTFYNVFILSVPLEVSYKLDSRRSSGQSAHRSRDSALASSVSSVHTPPADGAHSHYFDPLETPLPYSTKTLKGPYFNNQDYYPTPTPVEEAVAASPVPPSVHSSPRAGLNSSPERPKSPPIRPQTVSSKITFFNSSAPSFK